jgi:hypothetical protein
MTLLQHASLASARHRAPSLCAQRQCTRTLIPRARTAPATFRQRGAGHWPAGAVGLVLGSPQRSRPGWALTLEPSAAPRIRSCRRSRGGSSCHRMAWLCLRLAWLCLRRDADLLARHTREASYFQRSRTSTSLLRSAISALASMRSRGTSIWIPSFEHKSMM